MKRFGLAFSAAGLVTVLLNASPAVASCAGPVPIRRAIDDAPAVFVGTVTELENMRRWATVEVTDVWKGMVDDVVEVRAGPKDPPGPISTVTSIDRHYRRGREYLFVVYRGRGSPFRDNNCSRTTRYEPRLDRFRPASAIHPTPSVSEGETPSDALGTERNAGGSKAWWIGGAAVLAALGAGMLLFLRRSG